MSYFYEIQFKDIKTLKKNALEKHIKKDSINIK